MDESEQPIHDALVSIGSYNVYTDLEGVAEFLLGYGDYSVGIACEGYEYLSDTVHFNEGSSFFKFILEKIPEPVYKDVVITVETDE